MKRVPYNTYFLFHELWEITFALQIVMGQNFKELYDHMTKVGHTGLVRGCFGSGFSPLVVGKPARLIIRCLLEIKYKNCISWLKFLFLHLIWLPKQTLSSQGYLGFSKVDLLDNLLSLWEDLKMNLFDKYYCKW